MNEQCKARVFSVGSFRDRPCRKAAVKDGYCVTHHPDAVKARREKSEVTWQAKQDQQMAPYRAVNRLREQLNACVIALDALVERGIADARTMQLAREALDLVKAKEKS